MADENVIIFIFILKISSSRHIFPLFKKNSWSFHLGIYLSSLMPLVKSNFKGYSSIVIEG